MPHQFFPVVQTLVQKFREHNARLETAGKLLLKNMTVDDIADVTGLSPDKIAALQVEAVTA